MVNAIDTPTAPLDGSIRRRLITPNQGGTLGGGKSESDAARMCRVRSSLAHTSDPCGGLVRLRLTDKRFHATGRKS